MAWERLVVAGGSAGWRGDAKTGRKRPRRRLQLRAVGEPLQMLEAREPSKARAVADRGPLIRARESMGRRIGAGRCPDHAPSHDLGHLGHLQVLDAMTD